MIGAGQQSLQKIQRARHHIEELDHLIKGFLANKPYSMRVRTIPFTMEKLIYEVKLLDIPYELSSVFGDIVHNLRSSLDLVVFQSLQGTSAKIRSIQFPVASEADAFERAFKQGQLNYASREVQKSVRDIRPYPGGNVDILDVHYMNLCDKHRVQILAGGYAKMTQEDWGLIDPSMKRIFAINRAAKFSGNVFRSQFQSFHYANDTDNETKIQPKYDIFIEEIEFEGIRLSQSTTMEPAVFTLNRLADSVQDAVLHVAAAI